MKKYNILILLLLSLFLVGCNDTSTEDINTTVTAVTTLEIEEDKTYLVDVVDLTNDYSFSATKLNIYEYGIDPDIPYVDIEEFIGILDEGLVDLSLHASGDVLSVSYDIYYSETEFFTAILEFNAEENTIYYNDFNFSSGIGIDNIEYTTNIETVDFIVNDLGDTEKTIDLDDYDMEILRSEDEFHISFYLTNLLLSGDIINLYFNDDEIYIVDDPMKLLLELEETSLPTDVNETNLIKHTANYSALLFDNFYGLKEEFNYDDFVAEFASFDMYSASTIAEFDENFTEFIFDLDEIHTTVVDYGYNRDSVNLPELPTNSRYIRFITTLLNSGYFNKGYDISFTEEAEYYYLDIVEFNLETKDNLASFLQDLNPNKKIIVDLSTCTGGNLISVVELLAYVTNDPLDLNYINPATGESFTESLQSLEPKALENEFQFYTSYATFSAANLLVSIVKDNDLAIVFGSNTTGGACAVNYTVLPNNMIISYSTNFLLTNSSFESIEFGIEPDISVSSYDSFYEAYLETNRYLDTNADIRVVSTGTTAKNISLELIKDRVPSIVNINGYVINIYNKDETEILYSETIVSGDEFTFTHSFNDYQDLLIIRVNCLYQINGVDRVEEIGYRVVDDMSNFFTTDTVTVPIGAIYNANKYDRSIDDEYIKIEITEAAVYRIGISGDFDGSHKVYDLEGNEVARSNYFSLDVGTYIVEINPIREEGDYTILIESVYDDAPFGQNITLIEGNSNTSTVTYDYDRDVEWINLTLLEEAEVTISMDNLTRNYFIADKYGEDYNSHTDFISPYKTRTFILPKGEYMLGFHSANFVPLGSITVTFDVDYMINDFSGDIFLNDTNFGQLLIGENIMTFEGFCDRDIYELVLTEITDLMIDGGGVVSSCLIGEDGDCDFANQFYNLQPGTYYLMFTTNGVIEESVTQAAEIILLHDESTESNMLPIELDEEFTVIIEVDEDVDYYTFTIDELTTIEMIQENASTSFTRLYLDDGLWTQVWETSYDEKTFQLAPGDYILAIGEFVSELNEVEIYTVILNTYTTVDLDPNLTGLADEVYRTVDFTTEDHIHLVGEIDYIGDWDIYRIVINEAGTYSVSSYTDSDMQFYIILETGEWERVMYNTMELSVGVHYLLVRQMYDQDTISYELFFGKRNN
ncbi:MAG: hypothetical protein JEZ05_00725 [Tenericutes bacterium]|nr:hypothetical protein [Mycoplasmatota bacterium]